MRDHSLSSSQEGPGPRNPAAPARSDSMGHSDTPAEMPGCLLSGFSNSEGYKHAEKPILEDSTLPLARSASKAGRRVLKHLSEQQRATLRREQLKEAKQRQRARQSSLGEVTVTITLTAAESMLLLELCELQRGPFEGFYRRALMRGAVFMANAGNPRVRKAKGNVDAAAIRGSIVDTSTKPRGATAPADDAGML